MPFEVSGLRLQPYVADELFLNFEGHAYDRNRFYVGAYLNLAKNIRGELYYLWQSTKSDGGRDNVNAIGTGLKFVF